MEMSAEEVRKLVLSNKKYKNGTKVVDDILQTIWKYKGLELTLKHFLEGKNGSRVPELLLSLRGTVPVPHKGTIYNIPLVMWIPTEYPDENPVIFLTPTTRMSQQKIQQTGVEYVDENGSVDLDQMYTKYILGLDDEDMEPNLERLVDNLTRALCHWPPKNFVPPAPSPAGSSLHRPLGISPTYSEMTNILEHKNYKNPDATAKHVLQALAKFTALKPSFKTYEHCNGIKESLLNLAGTLTFEKRTAIIMTMPEPTQGRTKPIPRMTTGGRAPRCQLACKNDGKVPMSQLYQIKRYEFPVVIWITKNYPADEVIVFWKNSGGMAGNRNLLKKLKRAEWKSKNLADDSDESENSDSSEETEDSNHDSAIPDLSETEDGVLLPPANCGPSKSRLVSLIQRLFSRIKEKSNMRYVSMKMEYGDPELYGNIDEEIHPFDEYDTEDEDILDTKMDTTTTLRLFLLSFNQNGCQDVRDIILGLLNAKKPFEKSFLHAQLMEKLHDPNVGDEDEWKVKQVESEIFMMSEIFPPVSTEAEGTNTDRELDTLSETEFCEVCGEPAILSKDLHNDSKLLKALCNQLMSNENTDDSTPVHFEGNTTHFCPPCKELATQLQECEELTGNTQARMEQLKANIEKRVVDGILSDPEFQIASQCPESHTTLITLKNNIFQNYRRNLRLKKQQKMVSVEKGSASAATATLQGQQGSQPNGVQIGGVVTIGGELGGERGSEEASVSVVITSPHQNGSRSLQGTLVAEQSKVYWTRDSILDEGVEYLECGFKDCKFDARIPVGNSSVVWMKAAYETLEKHIKTDHDKYENELLPIPLECPYMRKCTCPILFASPESRDKHEVAHRTCPKCGEVFDRESFVENPAQILKTHKCPQRNNGEKRKNGDRKEKGAPAKKKKSK